MSIRLWFVSKESKDKTVKHYRGHRRLGEGHTRCGKTVDLSIIVEGSVYVPCKVCVAEQAADNTAALKVIKRDLANIGGDSWREEKARLIIENLFRKGFTLIRRDKL